MCMLGFLLFLFQCMNRNYKKDTSIIPARMENIFERVFKQIGKEERHIRKLDKKDALITR